MRFTLRDMFWATLLAAMAAAWWLEHSTLITAREFAYRLRENLRIARYFHEGELSKGTTASPPVDWKLADEPIP